MNVMKMTIKGLPLMAAAGAVLVSMVAGGSAGAAEITVFRGSEAIVVDTSAPQKGPRVLRGGMGTTKRERPRAAARQTVVLSPAIAGAGNTIWYQSDSGLTACWLRGTGYVGGLRIHCAGE